MSKGPRASVVIKEIIKEIITVVIRGRQGGHQANDSPGPQSLETRSCRTSGATRWPRLQSAAASKYLMREAIKGPSGVIRHHRVSSAASSAHTTGCTHPRMWRAFTLRGSRTKPSKGHPTQSEAIKAMRTKYDVHEERCKVRVEAADGGQPSDTRVRESLRHDDEARNQRQSDASSGNLWSSADLRHD